MKNKKIVEKYFKLSNKAQLKDIENLFDNKTTYSSENTGVFFGVKNIMKMMKSFFNSFEILHWKVLAIKELKENIFEVDFVLSGTKKENNDKILVNGLERVVVFEDKIRHIEIRNK